MKTKVGRAEDEKGKIKGVIKELEAVSPQTAESKAMIEELNHRVLQLSHAIGDYRVRRFLAPAVKWKEKVAKHSKTQSDKGSKPRARNGMTPMERTERDKKIIEHLKKASKNGHISLHGFAVKHSSKYGLKPTRIKQIIKSSLDT